MAPKATPVTLVVEPAIKRQLEEVAKRQDRSVSAVIRQAIRSYLEAQTPKVEAA